MPNRDEHKNAGAKWGAIIGGFVNLVKQLDAIDKGKQEQLDFLNLVGASLLSAGLGSIGAALPDILEPAINPNHRKFFHSLTAMMGISMAQLMELRKGRSSDEFWQNIITKIGFGYLIHLFQDSQTPKGLPLI